ncbi:hypothetical protein [Sinorhizobium medicae]|uniref:hypothetical protein n=1 Tax=Sinorhizobium medicae TaxID=110321 RepID=UPI0012955120|nr:hypothetical protein [Sinorhizobium medicae]MQX78115.1 hypothetical protein [Sinorhizobium medicae]
MPEAIGSLLPFFDPSNLANSIKNGLILLFVGLALVGNNRFWSRLENAVFNVCGTGIASYGFMHQLAAA